jgi:metal-responsive CopG/Arc/MetJ family transcriptional regulator
MSATIHIPNVLLKSVDRRAKSLGVSRNRLIVSALERLVDERPQWSADFLARLRKVDSVTIRSVEALQRDVKRLRRSRPPRAL